MNRVLGFMFFMLFLAGMAFLMLRNMQSAQPLANGAGSINILSGEWRSEDQTLMFEPGGRVSGFAGCNQFQGNYVATDTTIDIGPLAATRKACPPPAMERETNFLGMLERASGYSITGTSLRLIDDDNNSTALELTPVAQEGDGGE